MTYHIAIILCSSTLHNCQTLQPEMQGDMSLLPGETWYRDSNAQLRGGIEHEALYADAATYARRAKVANDMLRNKTIHSTSQWSDSYKLVPVMVLHTNVHVQLQRSDVQHISCIEDLFAANVPFM